MPWPAVPQLERRVAALNISPPGITEALLHQRNNGDFTGETDNDQGR
jgi:hypothetical protein